MELYNVFKMVDTKGLAITMFDSLHIRQEGAAQRIRDFAIHFFPNTQWKIHFDREVM